MRAVQIAWLLLLCASSWGASPALRASAPLGLRATPPSVAQEKAQAPDSEAASRRARWNKLSAEEKAELRARYERLQKLAPERRAELRKRSERLRREMEEIEASLGEAERKRLEGMKPKARREALKEMVAERAETAAAMVRTRMTTEERERIAAARPEERAEMLRVLRQRELDRLNERLQRLGRELGLSKERLAQLGSRSDREQRREIVARLRKRLEREVAASGLPDEIAPERWQKIQRRDDMGFLRAVERIRASHPEFGVPATQWEKRQARRARIADRMEGWLVPHEELRARFPDREGAFLRRRMIIDRRRRIERSLERDFAVRTSSMERLRALAPGEFVGAFGFVRKQILAGADVDARLARWLQSKERRRASDRR